MEIVCNHTMATDSIAHFYHWNYRGSFFFFPIFFQFSFFFFFLNLFLRYSLYLAFFSSLFHLIIISYNIHLFIIVHYNTKRIMYRLDAGKSDEMFIRDWFDGNVLDDRSTSFTNHRFNSYFSLPIDGHNEHWWYLYVLYEWYYNDVYW